MIPANKIFLTPEQDAYLRENYATTVNAVLCEQLHMSERTLVRLAKERGLEKDMSAIGMQRREIISASVRRAFLISGYKGNPQNGEKTRFVRGFKPAEMFGKEKWADAYRRSTETRKKIYAEEKARVSFGLPQRTKMRVIRQPQQKIQDRSYLKKRGYIIDDKNNIAFYTDATRRCTRLEAKPKRYYTFKPYELKELQ